MEPTHDAQANWNTGRLCTSAAASQDLFERLYDPKTHELSFNRRSPFWDAVAIAHDQGLRGGGRRIAVLDSGFDTDLKALDGAIAPESSLTAGTAQRKEHHGTLVAHLAHEVAPEAELILVDVAPRVDPFRPDVASALERIGKVDVDVINVSLEFPSDCPPRDTSVIDIDMLASAEPPEDEFVKQVRAWLTITDPYAPGGCLRACPICAAVRTIPEHTLIVGAAGNVHERVCPASSERCLALGFERQTMVTGEGGYILVKSLPENFRQTLLVELFVPQPEELMGTSFAAPLAAGFGALVDDRDDFAYMARMPIAMSPLLKLTSLLRSLPKPWESPAVETLNKGFLTFAEAVPERHRHWSEENPGPCATCSLFMVDWYNAFVTYLLLIAQSNRAAGLGATAAAVIPRSPDVAGNFGEALMRLSREHPEGSAERHRLAVDALHSLDRTLALRPEAEIWQERRNELLRREPWLHAAKAE